MLFNDEAFALGYVSCPPVAFARVAVYGNVCRHFLHPQGSEFMNKQELIDAVASATGASKSITGEAIDAVIGAVTQAVVRGDTVQLVGFGSFSQGARAARTGRNPATGEEIKIAAAKTVKFSAGKAFKDAVNGARK